MPATTLKCSAAALAAVFMFATIAPARSTEAATADDTARFLAGLPPSPNSPLAPLARDALWQQHARNFDALFAREESNSLSKIRAFSQERMPDKHPTLLYFFSGPDFLYANAFFPTATTYVLGALEPIGAVPQLTGLSGWTVDATLRNVEASLGTVLNYSFFITKNMKEQLNEGPVYGVLPILYVFLARSGMTIHDVALVGIDRDGNLLTGADTDGKKKINAASSGVRIIFSDSDGHRRTLYYFVTNLADGSIEYGGFIPFCAKLGPADAFLKSASYLMHKSAGFDKVRAFLLNQSSTILQDDSGIPFNFFDSKKWKFQAFGHYDGPLSIFGTPYQQQMAELFRKGSAIPIDFGVGYRWKKNESNLLLAQKIATGDDVLAPRLPADRTLQRTDGQAQRMANSPQRTDKTDNRKTDSQAPKASPAPVAGPPALFSGCLFCTQAKPSQ